MNRTDPKASPLPLTLTLDDYDGAEKISGWMAGRCRPIDFLQDRQLTKR